jgi:hypothetical protein
MPVHALSASNHLGFFGILAHEYDGLFPLHTTSAMLPSAMLAQLGTRLPTHQTLLHGVYTAETESTLEPG